jgi:hypothetical protein
MVLREMTKERRAGYRENMKEKHGQDYYQRKVIIHRNMKNGTLPTQRVIEKYDLTPDEILMLTDNVMNKLLTVEPID